MRYVQTRRGDGGRILRFGLDGFCGEDLRVKNNAVCNVCVWM